MPCVPTNTPRTNEQDARNAAHLFKSKCDPCVTGLSQSDPHQKYVTSLSLTLNLLVLFIYLPKSSSKCQMVTCRVTGIVTCTPHDYHINDITSPPTQQINQSMTQAVHQLSTSLSKVSFKCLQSVVMTRNSLYSR